MWFFLLGLNKIVRAEAHALELTRIMGHDGQTCMPGHANRGQRSSRRDLNLAGIGCPLGAVGPRLKRCTRAHGAVLQFPCLPRAKPTLVWAVSACLGLGRPCGRPWACAACLWAVPPSCKSQNASKDVICQSNPKPR